MDSQQAIDALKALRNTMADRVTGEQGQLDALDVAIKQLEGILGTEAVDLQEAEQQNVLKV